MRNNTNFTAPPNIHTPKENPGESGEGGRVANNCCHYPRRASEWSVELLGSVDFEGSLRKYADQKALDGGIRHPWLS